MSDTWIKVKRDILSSIVFDEPIVFKLYIYCLIKANRYDKQSIKGSSIVNVPAGSFVTSRKSLSEDLKISESCVERKLNILEKIGKIGQQMNSNYRLITVVNYGEHQKIGQQRRQQVNSNEDSIEDTTKKVKERKESKDNNYTTQFEIFWGAVPSKVDKKKSFKAYKSAIKKIDEDSLLEKIKDYSRLCEVNKTELEYIKHPSSWLNGECWENDYTPPAIKPTLDEALENVNLMFHNGMRQDYARRRNEERFRKVTGYGFSDIRQG